MTTIKTPFSINENGKVSFVTDRDSEAKQRVTDVLVTGKGERVMKPTYGANALDLLFEPVDDLLFAEFRMDAINELARSLSGVAVDDIIIKPANPYEMDDYATTLSIAVRYRVGPLDRASYTFSIGNPSSLTQESLL